MEKSVNFQSGRFRLWGMLHRPEGDGKAAGVVMCHGFTGHKAEAHFLFTKAARALAAAGLAVLRFDFRGSGDSEGDFRDMTISGEIEDAENALDFLSVESGIDRERLGVIGLSLGGCVAACLTGRRAEIKSCVLWSATAHPNRLTKRFFADSPERAEEMKRQGFLDHSAYALSKAFFEDSEKIEPTAELARSRSDVLIVHGTADETVPLSDADDYYRAARKTSRKVELVKMAEAGHTYATIAQEEMVIEVTAEFLRRSLSV